MYVEENEKYIEKINVVLSNRFSNAITNNFVPDYLGIMVTRRVQFCCIFAATKGKLDYF